MKKIIVKTSLITFLALIVLTLIAYFVVGGVKPKILADFYYQVGYYQTAEKYYERQYDKTGDVQDLYNIVVALDQEYQGQKTYNYAVELLNHQDFESFCQSIKVQYTKLSTEQYVINKGAVGLSNVDFNGAMDFCFEKTKVLGYTEFNAYRAVIASKTELTVEQKSAVKDSLNSLAQHIDNAEQLNNLNQDLELIND